MKLNWNRIQLLQNRKLSKSFAREETKKRKSRATNAERFKGIPVVKKYLDLPDEEKVCPVCNAPLVKIGEDSYAANFPSYQQVKSDRNIQLKLYLPGM